MKDGSRPSKLGEIAAILNGAGIETVLTNDILADSWMKYIMMCSNSTMFCYYDGPAGKVRGDPGHEKVLRAVIGEMIAVAAAKGIALPETTADRCVDVFSKMPPDTVTSLYRDLSGGKPASETELDHIIGRMVELGRETGVETPYHKTVYERFALK
jgi:2-dehydropantoate 2-reductase